MLPIQLFKRKQENKYPNNVLTRSHRWWLRKPDSSFAINKKEYTLCNIVFLVLNFSDPARESNAEPDPLKKERFWIKMYISYPKLHTLKSDIHISQLL